MKLMTIGIAAVLALGAANASARYVFDHKRWSATTKSVENAEATNSVESKACATRAAMLQGPERAAFLADCINNSSKN